MKVPDLIRQYIESRISGFDNDIEELNASIKRNRKIMTELREVFQSEEADLNNEFHELRKKLITITNHKRELAAFQNQLERED